MSTVDCEFEDGDTVFVGVAFCVIDSDLTSCADRNDSGDVRDDDDFDDEETDSKNESAGKNAGKSFSPRKPVQSSGLPNDSDVDVVDLNILSFVAFLVVFGLLGIAAMDGVFGGDNQTFSSNPGGYTVACSAIVTSSGLLIYRYRQKIKYQISMSRDNRGLARFFGTFGVAFILVEMIGSFVRLWLETDRFEAGFIKLFSSYLWSYLLDIVVDFIGLIVLIVILRYVREVDDREIERRAKVEK